MSESREGPRGPELQAGVRIVADVAGGGNATPEAVVLAADATGRPTQLLTGIPSPFEAAPVLSPDAPAGARPIMARALLVDPGTKVEAFGSLRTPARVNGLSTLVRQKGGADAPLSHILRIVGKRLAVLANDTEEDGGGGWLAFLGPGGALTRFADVLQPMREPGGDVRAGIRVDALFGPGAGVGWPIRFEPVSRGEDTGGSRISRGWLAVGPEGDWCPEVPIPDEIPPEEPGEPGGGGEGKPGGGKPTGKGEKGDKGEKCKDGRDGKQGKSDPLAPDDPWEDPEFDPTPDDPGIDELMRCDKPQPEEPGTPSAKPGEKDMPPPGTAAARRLSDTFGRTVIQPKEPPRLFDGDIRKHKGGGPRMRGAPLVPPGGIRLVTARDFAVGHTTWDALTFAIDKINQLISFVNERLPGAPTVTAHGALFLPPQKAADVRLDEFDDGTVVSVPASFRPTGSREVHRLLHQVTRDKAGRKVLARISTDRAPSRTLGTGERGADIEIRFDTGEPQHRSRGVRGDPQPKWIWDGRRKLFSVQRADLEVEALVVAAADGSESKVETSESTGAVTIKSTPAGGAEVTRTMPPRTGSVIQTPTALVSGQLVKSDANGDVVDVGDAAAARTLIGAAAALSGTAGQVAKFTSSTTIGNSTLNDPGAGTYGDVFSYLPSTDLWEKAHNEHATPTRAYDFRAAANEVDTPPWASSRTGDTSSITDLANSVGIVLHAEDSGGAIAYARAFYATNAWAFRKVVRVLDTDGERAEVAFRLRMESITSNQGGYRFGFASAAWADLTSAFEVADGAFFTIDPSNLSDSLIHCVVRQGSSTAYNQTFAVDYDDDNDFHTFAVVIDYDRGRTVFLVDGSDVAIAAYLPTALTTPTIAALSKDSGSSELALSHIMLRLPASQ